MASDKCFRFSHLKADPEELRKNGVFLLFSQSGSFCRVVPSKNLVLITSYKSSRSLVDLGRCRYDGPFVSLVLNLWQSVQTYCNLSCGFLYSHVFEHRRGLDAWKRSSSSTKLRMGESLSSPAQIRLDVSQIRSNIHSLLYLLVYQS